LIGLTWNDDPEWVEYVLSLRPVISAIAAKCVSDPYLREDCEQEAAIALLKVKPDSVSLYSDYKAGKVTEKQWQSKLSAYCRQVAHFTILSTLNSMTTGSLYTGRVKKKVNEKGEKVKYSAPARYSSLEELTENAGLQVDEHGNISWERVSTSGLDFTESPDYPEVDDSGQTKE
jgi:hypothetical protein